MLEVETVSNPSELLAVYRRLINKWHPDRHHSDPVAHSRATARAMEINEAFEYLSELFDRGLVPQTDSQAATASSTSWRWTTPADHAPREYGYRTYRTGFPDPAIVEVFVKSSNIVSIGYDRSSQILYIKFLGNRVYRYFDVPGEVFDEFLSAPSQGRFAHRHLYRRFQYDSC